jgi:hypothetical protein
MNRGLPIHIGAIETLFILTFDYGIETIVVDHSDSIIRRHSYQKRNRKIPPYLR